MIIGDKFIAVSDATATPAMARDLIARIRTVSDKPIKYVLLTTTTRCGCRAPAPTLPRARLRSSPARARWS